eukprot:GHVR01028606.1.p1 GENE.GHVR01028606.1~~GHVR01028606.1.p1  ORF type:complete len:152 (+),score=13.54 GHVR01028606.1:182-637(+)
MSSKSKGTSYTQLFYKTKICSSVYKGRPCSSGSACNFAHSDEEKRPLPDLRCTTLCKNVVSMGVCTVSHCPHAHAREELRISLVGEFKAKMCNFWKRGRCIDGGSFLYFIFIFYFLKFQNIAGLLTQLKLLALKTHARDGLGHTPSGPQSQ